MSQASIVEREMLELINAERTSRGLNPLQLELRLNDSAEDHSEWMLNADVFSHTGQGGSSAGDRMRDANFSFSGSWTWGENIAWQSERGSSGISDDVANLHTSLMNSAGHRANILNPNFELIGIGVEIGDYNGWEAVMVTQNFARTSSSVQIDDGGSGSTPVSTPLPVLVEDTPPPDAPTSGNDTLTLTSSGTINAGAGRDEVNGSGGNDTVVGGSGADTVMGNNGADKVVGGGGADRVSGGAGNDRVIGGGGRDTVDGGSGNDVLQGLNGDDTFVFSTGSDLIKDFQANADTIDLDNAVGISNFSDLVSNHMWERDGDVIIRDAAGNRTFLQDTSMAELDSGDFVF